MKFSTSFTSFDVYELEQMSRYLSMVSQAIENEKREYEAFVEKTVADLTANEERDFYDDHEDNDFEIKKQFPNLLFSSFLVSWYSHIEGQIIQLCQRYNITLTVNFDINLKKGIDRVKLFLREGKDYQIDPNHWQELQHIRKIRNFIVHNRSKLPVSYSEGKKRIPWEIRGEIVCYILLDENLYKYLSHHQLIDHVHHDMLFITLNLAFCNHLIEFGKRFVTKVYKDLDRKNVAEYKKQSK